MIVVPIVRDVEANIGTCECFSMHLAFVLSLMTRLILKSLSIRVKTGWMHHPPACCTGTEMCETTSLLQAMYCPQRDTVHSPCLLTTQVLRNLPSLSLEGAVMDQPVITAIDKDVVSVGSTIHDTMQQFSTLVLRAGRTSLPSVRVQDFSTPLTHKALLSYLMPLRPRICQWLQP